MVDDQLGRRTLSGISWTYAGTVAGVVLQVIYTAVMGRLLSPEDFGLLAMAGVVLRFGSYFAQMGVGSALVQKPDLTERDIRSGFTTSILLGCVAAFAIVVAAPLAGRLFTEDVVPVVRVMSVSFVLESSRITSRSILRRALKFRSLAVIDISTHAVSFLVIGIGMALAGAGVWSLVGATLSQVAFASVLQYVVVRHRVRPLLAWTEMKSLYGFGGRVSVISFLEFLGINLDVLAIGRYAGTAPLGHYNRAFMLVSLPFERFMTAVSTVLFPAVSRIQDDRARVRRAYTVTTQAASALLLPTAAGIAIASPQLVRVVLGPQWDLTAEVLPVLALAAAVGFLTHFAGVVAEALAALNRKIVIQVCYLIVLGAGIAVVVWRDGALIHYAAVVLAAQLLRHAAYAWLATSLIKLEPADHRRVYIGPLVTAAVVGVALYGVTYLVTGADLPDLAAFAIQLATGAIIWAIAFWWGPLAGTRRAMWGRLVAAGVAGDDSSFGRLVGMMLRWGR